MLSSWRTSVRQTQVNYKQSALTQKTFARFSSEAQLFEAENNTLSLSLTLSVQVCHTHLRYPEKSEQICDLNGGDRAGSSDHTADDLPHMSLAAATLVAVNVAD